MKRGAVLVLALVVAPRAAVAEPPSAEPAPAAPPAPAPPQEPSAPGAAPPAATPGRTTTIYTPYGLPAPGTDINAGLPSSSRPINGETRDTFDLAPKSSGTTVVRGSSNAAGIIGDEPTSSAAPAMVPELHVVTKGETLWALSGRYYASPWQWPKLWSYNAQIKDPHWIYPGDQILLRHPNSLGQGPAVATRNVGGARSRLTRAGSKRIASDTVFLRDQGFIGDPEKDEWGEVAGAVEEQMLLAEGSNVYLLLEEGKSVSPGQELTIYRAVRQPENVPGARTPPGAIVRVNGTVRVDSFDPKTRVARGVITESLDVVERGAKVGPVRRNFEVVARRPNSKEVEARILTSFYPHVYLAQNQIIFLDRGQEDGLAAGNTLYVLRRGDTWRKSLDTGSKMVRDRLKMDSPALVDIETTPLSGKEKDFPEEVVAELRVLTTEPKSSVALVIQSRRELVPGDRAVAPPGR